MFVLRDWRHNIVTVVGIWYVSATSERSIYFRISFNGIVWTEATFCYVLLNFDQIMIQSKYSLWIDHIKQLWLLT